MYRTADTVPVFVVQLVSEQIVPPDPRVQYILNRLQERGLPIPTKLPPISENPDLHKFTRLVYVDPTISLEQLISAIEVNGRKPTNYLNLSKVKDVVKTPDMPYFVWMQDGGCLYRGKYLDQAVSLFSSNERGATLREGLFLILYYPEILKDRLIDLPGSWYYRDSVTHLYGWDDNPLLSAEYAIISHSPCSSATCVSTA